TVENLMKLARFFQDNKELAVIRLPCRFFVGRDLVCEGEGGWSNRPSEWIRAWRFNKACRFTTHEPPSLWRGPGFPNGQIMNRQQAKAAGLIFDHYAYATLKQVTYKERFYGYRGLVNQWQALQRHQDFPVRLCEFFPWVENQIMVQRLEPENIPSILR